MKLAHFSDVHIGAGAATSDARAFCRMIDHAIGNGAEHLLIGGDLVDRGNVMDAKPVRDHLARRGFLHPDRLSIVPGNHDIWPIGHSALESPAAFASVMVRKLKAHATGSNDPAQDNLEALVDLFSEAFDGAETFYSDLPLPCVKQVGPIRLGLLDTTSHSLFTHAQGRFAPAEGRWLKRALGEREGPSILLMHHWPFPWTAVDSAELPGAVHFLADTLGLDLEALCDVNFEDLAAVRRFIRTGNFDAVLCGHMHEGDRDTIGDVPVFCMGRSGGEDGASAYDLINATPRSIRARTHHV